MFAGRGLTVIAGPQHFDQWSNVGLVQAFRAYAVDCRPGSSAEAGKAEIRSLLERRMGESPSLGVFPDATWTLRAFAGGYVRPFHNGVIAEEPENNLT
jgi:hypothetical protein